jgi:ribosomal protein S18 acetylase RimI-like enzyme
VDRDARIHVREALPADGERILELDRELADFERLAGPNEEEGRRLLEWIFKEKRFEALVAERNGSIVGVAIYFFFPTSFRAKPALYIEDIVVSEAARSSGAGEALMAELALRAESAGCGRMEWAVLPWNEGAIRFYERLGARREEEWVRYRIEQPFLRTLARLRGK